MQGDRISNSPKVSLSTVTLALFLLRSTRPLSINSSTLTPTPVVRLLSHEDIQTTSTVMIN